MATLRLEDALGPDGPVAACLGRYEVRPGQQKMLERVGHRLQQGGTLLVEAPTGIGKTFAYLIPALVFAEETGNPVVVSTHTINLQEQILNKDIPLLRKALASKVRVVLAKGRSNYVCLRRLAKAHHRRGALFTTLVELEELDRILRWSEATRDGSLSDLGFRPSPRVWSWVRAEYGTCPECPYEGKCFFDKMRRSVRRSGVVVTNHHLYFTEFSMLGGFGKGILPEHSDVIFDEGQNLEAVARDHLGSSVSERSLEQLFESLAGLRGERGLLVALRDEKGPERVETTRRAAEEFFTSVRKWFEGAPPKVPKAQGKGALRIRHPWLCFAEASQERQVPETLLESLRGLVEHLEKLQQKTVEPEDQEELAAQAGRLREQAKALDLILSGERPELVYWAEGSSDERQRPVLTLEACPLEVGTILRESFFSRYRSMVLTSATLSQAGNFDFLRSSLGLQEAEEAVLESPFDFREQVRLLVFPRMPEPGVPGYEEGLAREIVGLACRPAMGRMLVLFTNLALLDAVHEKLQQPLREQGVALYKQGEVPSRHRLLVEFGHNSRAVLLGAESFWQGVDAVDAGGSSSLGAVVITRLPFPVPSDPVVEAKSERLREQGADPFRAAHLPEAILRLRQGFGRLIRSRSDQGIVAILDSRILKRWYGKLFLQSLPDCDIEVVE